MVKAQSLPCAILEGKASAFIGAGYHVAPEIPFVVDEQPSHIGSLQGVVYLGGHTYTAVSGSTSIQTSGP